ncbi:MAG: zinc ribbon domain-containing protein [Deltaproteobacteria bacterium]|nr:zinc ribbon domain-containing protein [Deltaproteobacteria bacterium]
MAEKSIVCPSCGFKNAAGVKRCVSCGAKTTELSVVVRSKQEQLERRYQQEAFSLLWLLIAVVVQAVLTGAIILGLPQVVSALDFEGSHGMIASIGIWFVGGMLVGMISPGRTFLEPFIASFIIAIPTVLYLYRSQTVFTLPPFLYVVMGGIGILFALIGSYLGERIQLGPPPKTAD